MRRTTKKRVFAIINWDYRFSPDSYLNDKVYLVVSNYKGKAFLCRYHDDGTRTYETMKEKYERLGYVDVHVFTGGSSHRLSELEEMNGRPFDRVIDELERKLLSLTRNT